MTWIVPAQVNPPSQASSSPSLTESSRDSKDASAFSDSSITCASTHPPMVTAPSMRPCSLTHILAPSFLGLVPRVATSVAIATRFSAFPNISIWSKTSSIVVLQDQVFFQRPEARQIMYRGEHVDMRKRRLHPAYERLIGRT